MMLVDYRTPKDIEEYICGTCRFADSGVERVTCCDEKHCRTCRRNCWTCHALTCAPHTTTCPRCRRPQCPICVDKTALLCCLCAVEKREELALEAYEKALEDIATYLATAAADIDNVPKLLNAMNMARLSAIFTLNSHRIGNGNGD
jgi:hypothetical protein